MRNIGILIILLTFCCGFAKGQEPMNRGQKSRNFASVEPVHVSTTLIDKKSKLEVLKKGGHRSFDLKLPTGSRITKIAQAESPTHFVLVYQYNILKDGTNSQLIVIDKRSLELVAQKELHSFNISEPLIHGQSFFIALAGYVGEYSLHSGSVLWEFKNLYGRPYYFDGVSDGETIEVDGHMVHFGPRFPVDRLLKRIDVEDESM